MAEGNWLWGTGGDYELGLSEGLQERGIHSVMRWSLRGRNHLRLSLYVWDTRLSYSLRMVWLTSERVLSRSSTSCGNEPTVRAVYLVIKTYMPVNIIPGPTHLGHDAPHGLGTAGHSPADPGVAREEDDHEDDQREEGEQERGAQAPRHHLAITVQVPVPGGTPTVISK